MNSKTKSILLLSGLTALGITGFMIYKKIKNKSQVTKSVKAVTGGTITTLGINIPEIAAQLGIELGTAYGTFDPRHWTENDTVAKELVLKVPKPLIKTLISEYYKKYQRNLVDDLQRDLDDWAGVSYLFT